MNTPFIGLPYGNLLPGAKEAEEFYYPMYTRSLVDLTIKFRAKNDQRSMYASFPRPPAITTRLPCLLFFITCTCLSSENDCQSVPLL